ncbi:MAG: hypothetical protein KDA89_18675, partial [Planctomycetaceae bacterium]|nr:hypothetical protein [Planctomycetaceae bacterium]
IVPRNVRADESIVAAEANRSFSLQASIRSWNPADPIHSHKQHSRGMCSPGGTIGIGVGGKNGFSVEVRCLPGDRSMAAVIKLEPSESNRTLDASTTEVDLSDLHSDYISVAEDDDGRKYFLIIEPEILETRLPTQFKAEALAIYDWDFPSSPVIVDDEVYVGRVGMSGGPVVGIDIAGIAGIEFSLLPLKDGTPTGTLQGGTLTIGTDDHVVMISGVRNGAAKQTLDGPHKVWVRNTAGSNSAEEMKTLLREQLQLIEKRKADGDASITDDVIARVRGFIESGRPMLLGSHARSVRQGDLQE